MSVLPLQAVDNPDYLLYFERKWMHRLASHKKLFHREQLNVNTEVRPFTHPARPPNNNPSKKSPPPPSLPPSNINSTSYRLFPLHPVTSTISHIARHLDIVNKNNKIFNDMSLTKLYKLLSACHGKPIYHRPRPTTAEEFLFWETQSEWLHANLSEFLIHTVINKTVETISQRLQGLKMRHKVKKTFPSFNIFTTTYLGSSLKSLPMAAIMNRHAPLLPYQLKYFIRPKIIYKNPKPTAFHLYNYRQTSALLTPNLRDLIAPCPCANVPDPFKKEGHLCTGNPDVLRSLITTPHTSLLDQLIQLLKFGTKYIETIQPTARLVFNTYHKALQEYAIKLAKIAHLEPHELTSWVNAVSNELQPIMLTTFPKKAAPCLLGNIHVKEMIKILQDSAVITCIDKLPNNYAFTCKKYWLTALHNSTLGPNQKTYKIVSKPPDEVITRHKAYLNNYNFKTHDRLPFKYITPKLHKDGWRPLCAATTTTTTYLSKSLTVALKAVILSLKRDAQKFEMLTGVNTFYDIENAQDVHDKIHHLNNLTSDLASLLDTADIVGWYDYVQHFDLIRRFKQTLYEVFTSINRRAYLVVRGKEFTWTNQHTPSTYHTHCFSATSLLRLLVWRLKNQFIMVGPILVKQVVGTGQGDNHSGHLCRLLSIIYERKFATYWAKNDISVAKLFNHTVRKHDDYAFFNNSLSYNYFYKNNQTKAPGLLPAYFSLKYTTIQPDKSHYLDTTIQIVPNPHISQSSYASQLDDLSSAQLKDKAKSLKLSSSGDKATLKKCILQAVNPINNFHNKAKIWSLKTFNKRDHFDLNFQPISFPHFSTNLVRHSKTGAIYGQLHSYLITNYVSLEKYLQNVRKLFLHLTNNNAYPLKLLIRCFIQFIRRKRFIYHTSAHKVLNIFLRTFHHGSKT